MNEIQQRYEVSKRDLAKGRNLRIAAWTAPAALTALPAVISLLLLFLTATTPPAAATVIFFGLMFTFIGLIAGLGLAGFFSYRRSLWKTEMRERIALDGIRAEEIEWFTAEMKSAEKRALADITRKDALLADAYRETLASRLTATRIVKSSKRELLLAQKRKSKIKYSKSSNREGFQTRIEKDIAKISAINDEAKLMLGEAEDRLHMIEAASIRGSGLADSELVLKKLSARASTLPIALESTKIEEEIRRELELEGFPDSETERFDEPE